MGGTGHSKGSRGVRNEETHDAGRGLHHALLGADWQKAAGIRQKHSQVCSTTTQKTDSSMSGKQYSLVRKIKRTFRIQNCIQVVAH